MYVHIAVRKETKERFLSLERLIKDRNPSLRNLPMSQEFILKWIIEVYEE